MDNLKLINDTYGHMKGDRALITIAKGLCAAFEFSFLARTGGDEFVVIVGNSKLCEVFPKIEKFRGILDSGTEDLPKVSVSLGYCKLKENSNYNEAFIKAEHMMYHEKVEKKNMLRRRDR
jgi:diguanylate cyclase (GGDEF)-like protein